MYGGEVFIPKIPSIYITDLAEAMAPKLNKKIIGIRPGEKLHEIMCPSDDSHLTIEFHDHFVIKPTIIFSDRNNKYLINNKKEKGKLVKNGFEYNSFNNPKFLTVNQIKKLNKEIEKNQIFPF